MNMKSFLFITFLLCPHLLFAGKDVKQLTDAAMLQDTDAMAKLATIYHSGKGAKKDMQSAYMWGSLYTNMLTDFDKKIGKIAESAKATLTREQVKKTDREVRRLMNEITKDNE